MPDKPDEHVDIRVRDGAVEVSKDLVPVSLSARNSVIWHCSQGTAAIQFIRKVNGAGKEKSPFVSERFDVADGGFSGSGPVFRGSVGDRFKYEIRVTIPGDRRSPYVADPEVQVENG
jgi:hypothetical protein